MTPKPAVPPSTTQQQHPGRAFGRTFVQVLLGLPTFLLILAGILNIIAQDEFARYLPEGWGAWLLGVSAGAAALAATLARIMAIPDVDRFLKRFRLSSDPNPSGANFPGQDHPADLSGYSG